MGKRRKNCTHADLLQAASSFFLLQKFFNILGKRRMAKLILSFCKAQLYEIRRGR